MQKTFPVPEFPKPALPGLSQVNDVQLWLHQKGTIKEKIRHPPVGWLMATSPELLRVAGLRKTFYVAPHPKTVLNEVNFTLPPTTLWRWSVPSGCGKTTLLLMIAGLLSPSEGTILLEGSPMLAPSRGVALVLQHYGLFPWKTVAANISLGAKLQKIRITDAELHAVKRELGIEDLTILSRTVERGSATTGRPREGYPLAAEPAFA